MSLRTSYSSSSYAPDKGTPYSCAPSRSSSMRSTTSSTHTSTSASSSVFAHSAQSSRNYRYGSKPPGGTTVHNGGGQSNDPNTSTSAPNSGYYN